MLDALTRGHINLYHGGSSTELLYSSELAVMEDDVAGWIGRVLEGATINDETLAIDLINEVGPLPGHYLGTAHTRKWWNKEHYFPKVANVESYASWIKTGKKDMLGLAKEKVQEILATHEPLPLSDAQEQAIEDVLEVARDYYRKQGMICDAVWAQYIKVLSSGE